MRFLFDLQHPAHLHFFRPVISRLKAEGHQILITARDKDILIKLAACYKIPMTVFGTAKQGFFNLGKEWLHRQWRLKLIIRKFKPDVMMAVAGTYISLLGRLKEIPTYIFYDTEHATISNFLSYPFATCIYVPQCYRKKIHWHHKSYNGYHEIAYLHPNYFTPDESVLTLAEIRPGEIFSLVRFVGWSSGHDIGRSGLSVSNKIRAIKELGAYGKVLISSEAPLPPELERYRLNIDISKIHSLMAYAAIIFGESATMVSEGAILGVPGVYIDPVGRGYTDELQSVYKIVSHYTHRQQNEAIKKAATILEDYKTNQLNEKAKWRRIRDDILHDKIDVTEMIYEIATVTNINIKK